MAAEHFDRVKQTVARVFSWPKFPDRILASSSPITLKPLSRVALPLTAVVLAGAASTAVVSAKEGGAPYADTAFCAPGAVPNFDQAFQKLNLELGGAMGNPLE